MLRFGLIGNPVTHSLSPLIHQLFAQQFNISLQYEKIQGTERILQYQIDSFLGEGGIGLNITVPFKQRAFELVKLPSARSQLSQAVNTLWLKDGVLCGDNTDGIGLVRDLIRYIDPSNKKILVLGAGGAASGILPSLLEYTHDIVIANRTLERAITLTERFPALRCCRYTEIQGVFDIVINATSATVFENNFFLPELVLQHANVCYDLNYLSHGKTSFCLLAHSHGSQAVDGIGMLVEQAAEGFLIWHQRKPQTAPVIEQLRQAQC